jgi:hypothetical protein
MTTCYHPEHRLFFIHIPKCAGTSIGGEWNTEHEEWTGCWLDQQLPGWTREGLPNGHQPVFAIDHFTGKQLDWWKKIIVTVRNPFEQQFSQWKFWRERGLGLARKGIPGHADDRFALESDFDDFVTDGRSNGPNAYCGNKWQSAGGVYRWWCAAHDNTIPPNVDIIRVEDFPGAMQACLQPFMPEGQTVTAVPHTNATTDADMLAHYTEAAVHEVARKFSWSLAVFYPGLAVEMLDRVSQQQYV